MKRPPLLAMVGLLVFAGSALAGFSTGTYKGKTDQKLSIEIKVNKTTMLSAKYKANYTCRLPDGTSIHASAQPTSLAPATIRSGGKIDTHEHTPGGLDKVHLLVTLKGKIATGSFRETDSNSSGVVCQSGVVKFKIKH